MIYIINCVNRRYYSYKKGSCRDQKLAICLLKTTHAIVTLSIDSPIAQSVEHRTVNPLVAGSSPAWGAKIQDLRANASPFFFGYLPAVYPVRTLPYQKH